MNKDTREADEKLLNEEKDKYPGITARAYNEALNKYGEQEASLKSKLQIMYINTLARWYSRQSRLATLRAEAIKLQVQKGDDDLALAIRNFQSNFFRLASVMASDTVKKMTPEEKSKLAENIATIESEIFMGNYYSRAEIPGAPMVIIEEQQPPDPPIPGQELGIFKPISQWLLTPRYMALVLIVGMLGFGLFGSAVSTFVRTNLDPDNDGIIDVTGVIVRGASAAIVIFLAVKGGISVFIQGDSELNPYSIFLTCLIGAVYSERVWVWAKEQLEGKFPASNTSVVDNAPTTTTPAAGESQPVTE
jgi:hypothetical protein